MQNVFYQTGRRLLFPGFDIHTRSRASLCKFWQTGERRVLDAGCGNGYFSYLAWKSGATVDAVTFEQHSAEKANSFFAEQVKTGRLNFIYKNLYDLDYPAETFDEIICYEVLEHLVRDREMMCRFSKWLKPGGVLHLCTPNKQHPFHANTIPSATEDGWHVRQGYDRLSYEDILAQAGLKPDMYAGIGTLVVWKCDDLVGSVRRAWGHGVAAPFFLLTWPIWPWFCLTSPDTGYSIYVKGVKPAI
ncbi:MAG: class I SAM-dependent methyltransferase [Cyanosarcina radialis HA8281-LM2]|jgi:ubiquinone/menaquinone biosynthesis C-methylase UbiE|nr:class I SAM-dependent methyltransferase [Cyanosarcina radialis HA8281-LM2]